MYAVFTLDVTVMLNVATTTVVVVTDCVMEKREKIMCLADVCGKIEQNNAHFIPHVKIRPLMDGYIVTIGTFSYTLP